MGSAKRDGRQLMDGVTMALLAAVKALIILGRKASLHRSPQWLITKLQVLWSSPLWAYGTINRSAVNKTICRQNIPLERQHTQGIDACRFHSLRIKFISITVQVLICKGKNRKSLKKQQNKKKELIWQAHTQNLSVIMSFVFFWLYGG